PGIAARRQGWSWRFYRGRFMSIRSSIFSFETLTLPRRPAPGWVFAIVLLLTAEVGARLCLHWGLLTRDMPGPELMIEMSEAKTKETPHEIWLMGNSTLEAIDPEMITRIAGRDAVRLPHHAAAVRASAVTVDYLLSHTVYKPATVVLFVWKDDLSA